MYKYMFFLKNIYTLLCLCLATGEIKHSHVPSCINCKFYKPLTRFTPYASQMNLCTKFVKKDIITDKTTYEYADICRKLKFLCGYNAIYYVEKRPITHRMTKNRVWRVLSMFIVALLVTTLFRIVV